MSQQKELKDKIYNTFNLDEVRGLCFNIELNYDELPGDRLSRKIESLLIATYRADKFLKLNQELSTDRPKIDWPTPAEMSSWDWESFTKEVEQEPSVTFSQSQKIAWISVVAIIVVTVAAVPFALNLYQNWQNAKIQPRNTNDFVVAIAEFQLVGESLTNNPEEIPVMLATRLPDMIETIQETPLENDGLENLVNSDDLDNVVYVFPDEINMPVLGNTPQERALAADEIAQAYNADVVVYGTITLDGWEAALDVEFLVTNSYVELGEGAEFVAPLSGDIGGSNQPVLRMQILSKNDNSRALDDAAKALSKSFQALNFIMLGLSDYALGNYETAESEFAASLLIAESIAEWQNYEVIHLLIGNAKAQQCAQLIHDEESLDLVTSCFEEVGVIVKEENQTTKNGAYTKSIAINPSYPRPYLGLASAYQVLSVGGLNSKQIDLNLLAKAKQNFLNALESDKNQYSEANIKTKANLGLGKVYLTEAQAKLASGEIATLYLFSAAVQHYGLVIQECERQNCSSTNDFWMQAMATHAWADLGLIHWQVGATERSVEKLNKAISMYQKAVDLAPPFGGGQQHLVDSYKDSIECIRQDITIISGESPQSTEDGNNNLIKCNQLDTQILSTK